MNIALLPSAVYTDPTYHRVLTSLKREFDSAGHKTRILTLESGSWPSSLQIKPETSAVCLAHSGRTHLNGKPGPLIRSLTERLSPGTILNFHFAGWLRAWHAPVLLSGQLASLRLAVTFQDYRHPDLPPLTSAMRGSLKKIIDRAYCVSAVSGFLAGMIRRDFPSAAGKLLVIPNGTDIPGKADNVRRGARRRYILTVGRPAPYKGLDLLIFAFAKAAKNGCDADLVICGTDGGGNLANLAQKLGIGGNVIFKGLVSHRKISALMRDCLFYATAPRWESFGMAALEAMAAGKAVLASKTGGLPCFAENNYNALLTEPADIGSISSGIRRLYMEARLREKLGKNAAGTARKYSWKKIADQYALAFRRQRQG